MRPGHVVLFRLPEGKHHSGVEMGFLTSVWKGVKIPRLYAGETPVNSCMAFRAVAMDLVNMDI